MAKEKVKSFKKSSGKIKKQKDFKTQRKELKRHLLRGGKSTSVLLKNLPFSIKVGEVKVYCQKFGDVCEVKLIKRKGGRPSGNAFVHFNSVDSAEAAIKHCSGDEFMGRKLHAEWAEKKPVSENAKEYSAKNKVNIQKIVKEEEEYDSKDDVANIAEDGEDDEKVYGNINDHKGEIINKQSSINSSSKAQFAKKKKGRIIVRNLSFKVTEEKLIDHFRQFGAISEVKLLKKEDGKLVGCGFVQFENTLSASQAIQERNGKSFLGRPIICDWAVPKNKYLKHITSEVTQDDDEKEAFNGIKIKEEPHSDESENETHIKMESDNEPDDDDIVDEDDSDDYEEEEEAEIDDEMGEEDEHQSHQRSKKPVGDGNLREKKPKVISNDVTEGCTIFIKNIPFSATNDDLKMCMKQFGPLEYALICMDTLTEHSKGTGFVKFKKREDAEACLQASEELMVHDQVIEVLRAISRDDIKSMDNKKKEKQVKDKRHLYLVKEGVILAGSPAARDVSVSDMAKRLKIEQWKTQMLRNLNMFVSNTRLVVYNVPLSWTDDQIRQLFKKHAGPGAIIKEARIMKDIRNVDANGVGKSKEFAFVHFTQQNHALQALRKINNNPDIFTKGKRPIVSFSIENKAIHKIKEKRLQKSRQKIAEKQNQSTITSRKHKGDNKFKGQNRYHKSVRPGKETEVQVETKAFSGLEGRPGNNKMRTKFKLKTQAAVHQKNVKENKRKRKLEKKAQERNIKQREPQPKKKRIKEDDSFNKLVNKYKAQLMASDYQKRWYE